jgi:hypothetical protein
VRRDVEGPGLASRCRRAKLFALCIQYRFQLCWGRRRSSDNPLDSFSDPDKNQEHLPCASPSLLRHLLMERSNNAQLHVTIVLTT